MDFWQSILLGVVQGLTEFLPISSSGHLLMGGWLLGDPLEGQEELKLAFDVALHGGTLIALLAYFRADVRRLAGGLWRGGLRMLRGGRPGGASDEAARMSWLIVLGTVPAGIAVLGFKPAIEAFREHPDWSAMILIGFSAVFIVADRMAGQRQMDGLGLREILAIGCAQALALVPGVSRSGATISAGMMLGLARSDAARFSFLLSIPAVLGAQIVELPDLAGAAGADGHFYAVLAAGVAAAAISGYAAIAGLLRFLGSHSLSWFVAYRVPAGLVFLVLYGTGTQLG